MDDFSITDDLMFRVHGAIERRAFFTMGVMGGPASPPPIVYDQGATSGTAERSPESTLSRGTA